eukprot:jgi/Psemu1/205636/e_gw1.382.47.1
MGGILDAIYEVVPGVRKFHATLNQLTSYVPPPPVPEQGSKQRRVLLVTTHNVPESFSLAIAQTVEDAAKQKGHEVERIDLGLEGFAPVLTAEEHRGYLRYKDELTETTLPGDVRGYIQKLQWCDTLVFVYPTWWMGGPANLKGFFDRTLRLHYTWGAPKEESSRFLPAVLTPGLVNIDRVFGISTYGASWPVVVATGDCGRGTIAGPVRAIMNPDCTIRWKGLYEIDATTPARRQRFLEEVETMVRDHV